MKLEKGITVIIGSCATGKTTLSQYLKRDNPGALVFTCDEYLQYGTEALAVLTKAVNKVMVHTPKIIIEGMLAYKFLRVSQQLGKSYPICTIYECTAPKEVRQERIRERAKDVQATFNMDAIYYKTLVEYKRHNPSIQTTLIRVEQYA